MTSEPKQILFNRRVLGLLHGQLISVLISGTILAGLVILRRNVLLGTGVFSSLLQQYRFECSITQSLPVYALLAHCFFPLAVIRARRSKFVHPWWFYAIISLLDVTGNYLLVRAYQYTSIISVALLSPFTIPCVVFISWLILKAKFKSKHLMAVGVCLMGLLSGVVADLFSDVDPRLVPDGGNLLLGDALILMGSFMYALCNVGQEFLVKRLTKGKKEAPMESEEGREASLEGSSGGGKSQRAWLQQAEYLGFVGLFGTMWSIIGALLIEREKIAKVNWGVSTMWGFYAGFIFCLFFMYVLTSYFMVKFDATVFNLSLLTSNIYSLGYAFSYGSRVFKTTDLFIPLALVFNTCGVAWYHSMAPPTSNLSKDEEGAEDTRDEQKA